MVRCPNKVRDAVNRYLKSKGFAGVGRYRVCGWTGKYWDMTVSPKGQPWRMIDVKVKAGVAE